MIERRHGSVAEHHATDPFADGPPQCAAWWWLTFDQPTLVLGSRQSESIVDRDALERDGVALTRRRSGGGAVLMRPDEVVWVDFITPNGVLPDDVRGSMVAAGELWVAALSAIGVAADSLTVHDGPMVDGPWSELVCFAGIGPGEVIVAGRKLVGLSQRRTRHGVRVQGLIHLNSSVAHTPRYLRSDDPETGSVTPAFPPPDAAVFPGESVDALIDALGQQPS